MPISWDATMDRKLFLAIMKVHSISVDCEAVATVLTTDGDPCTKIAVMRRIQKIKETLKDGPKNGSNEATASPDGKPTKKRGAGAAANGSPIKKAKTTAEVKQESGDEEE